MKREYRKWWSPSLGREMEMVVFGDSGTPVLAFPTSMGRFFEWEDFGMIESLSYQIEEGHNQVFCIDSVDDESFYNKEVDPYVRIMRHRQYEEYIQHEVIPRIQDESDVAFLIAAGCNFGAYHSFNYTMKHPTQIDKIIAMGGSFDIRPFMDDFEDDNVYFNNPIAYMPNLRDEKILSNLREIDIRLVTAEHDDCLPANQSMSDVLNNKHISHQLDIWTHKNGHDWSTWQDMIKAHIV